MVYSRVQRDKMLNVFGDNLNWQIHQGSVSDKTGQDSLFRQDVRAWKQLETDWKWGKNHSSQLCFWWELDYWFLHENNDQKQRYHMASDTAWTLRSRWATWYHQGVSIKVFWSISTITQTPTDYSSHKYITDSVHVPPCFKNADVRPLLKKTNLALFIFAV